MVLMPIKVFSCSVIFLLKNYATLKLLSQLPNFQSTNTGLGHCIITIAVIKHALFEKNPGIKGFHLLTYPPFFFRTVKKDISALQVKN